MADEKTPRIPPILPSEWTPEILDALGAFPKGLEFVLSRWKAGGADARGMHVLGVMAHHPALTKAFMTFNAHVAGASTLAVRVRELAILRISWLMHSEYEFVQHVILGKRAGLTDGEIERVQRGGDAQGWSADDADILRAVDELHVDSGIGEATWARLSKTFSPAQRMDLVFLVGCYGVLAAAINSFKTPLEPDVVPLSDETRARLLASPRG